MFGASGFEKVFIASSECAFLQCSMSLIIERVWPRRSVVTSSREEKARFGLFVSSAAVKLAGREREREDLQISLFLFFFSSSSSKLSPPPFNSRLHSNNLNCDCHLAWLAQWLRQRPTIGLFTQCTGPTELRGLNVAEVQKHEFSCSGRFLTHDRTRTLFTL